MGSTTKRKIYPVWLSSISTVHPPALLRTQKTRNFCNRSIKCCRAGHLAFLDRSTVIKPFWRCSFAYLKRTTSIIQDGTRRYPQKEHFSARDRNTEIKGKIGEVSQPASRLANSTITYSRLAALNAFLLCEASRYREKNIIVTTGEVSDAIK